MAADAGSGPRFSVIIPTYQRREVVLASVRALSRLTYDGDFEVTVVVDGSTDGSADALRALNVSFPLTVIEQPNRGAAAARNRGAEMATGGILLFLDDDMEADPRLLTEHAASYRAGADAVLGHVPLHPDSPANFLSRGVGSWAEARRQRLVTLGAQLTPFDLVTGQLSVRREVFYRLGGFDGAFTRGGAFGDEDLDFGCRLSADGYRVVFNPAAVSWQRYVVSPHLYLRQWREAGSADAVFARKHPRQAAALFALRDAEAVLSRRVCRPLLAIPQLACVVTTAMRAVALPLAARRPHSPRTSRLFFMTRDLEYWRGVQEAGDIPRPRPVRVLAYHAIADLRGDRWLERYSVPPGEFERQLDTLEALGFTFISAGDLLRFLQHGAGLPRRPVLLTFDDCYEDLLTTVLPILKERGIAAAAFAVSARLGGTNEWDRSTGASVLRLLDAAGLRTLADEGVEIGAHSRTHRLLTRLPPDELLEEIAGSVADLENVGLTRPRLFAYPYGEHDGWVRQATQAAGAQAAFAVEPGRVRRGGDVFQLPRIEILRRDVGRRFLWKVVTAGRCGDRHVRILASSTKNR